MAISPLAAAGAYQAVASAGVSGTEGGQAFSGIMRRALEGVVDSGHQADAKAMDAIGGSGSITDVVSAVAKAELALQTTVAIRDRVVAAYQDIMRMPI